MRRVEISSAAKWALRLKVRKVLSRMRVHGENIWPTVESLTGIEIGAKAVDDDTVMVVARVPASPEVIRRLEQMPAKDLVISGTNEAPETHELLSELLDNIYGELKERGESVLSGYEKLREKSLTISRSKRAGSINLCCRYQLLNAHEEGVEIGDSAWEEGAVAPAIEASIAVTLTEEPENDDPRERTAKLCKSYLTDISEQKEGTEQLDGAKSSIDGAGSYTPTVGDDKNYSSDGEAHKSAPAAFYREGDVKTAATPNDSQSNDSGCSSGAEEETPDIQGLVGDRSEATRQAIATFQDRWKVVHDKQSSKSIATSVGKRLDEILKVHAQNDDELSTVIKLECSELQGFAYLVGARDRGGSAASDKLLGCLKRIDQLLPAYRSDNQGQRATLARILVTIVEALRIVVCSMIRQEVRDDKADNCHKTPHENDGGAVSTGLVVESTEKHKAATQLHSVSG